MEIKISTKKKKAIKKLLKKTDAEFKQLIERVVDNWIVAQIISKYSSHKTVDKMMDDINK